MALTAGFRLGPYGTPVLLGAAASGKVCRVRDACRTQDVDGASTLWRVVVVASLFLFAGAPAGAQSNPCDPHLSQLAQGSQGYRLRGDRCEGIYSREVESATLLLASFTEVFEEFNTKSPTPLSIEWSSAAGGSIHLRAYALHEKLYYQMDAIVPSAKNPFLWPTDILDALHLSQKDIGVVGFTDEKIGEHNETLYLPLRIRQEAKTKPMAGYQLVVLPGSESDSLTRAR